MSKLNFPDPNVTGTYTAAGITWTYNDELGVWSTDGIENSVQPVDLSYTYPGSGYTRQIKERLTDGVSVKDYGAKGNGTDETAIIQKVVDTIPAEGGRIYFPKGTYNFSGLNLNKKKILAVLDTGATIPDDSGLAKLESTEAFYSGWSKDQPRDGFNIHSIDLGTTTQWQKQATGNNNLSESFLYMAKGYFLDTNDNPGEISAYGFDITTDQDSNDSIVRGVKGVVRGDGGKSNLRCMRLLTEGAGNHSGNITGILMTVIRSELWYKPDKNGPYYDCIEYNGPRKDDKAQGVAFQADMGAGAKYGYTVAGYTYPVEIDTCYTVAGGDNRVEPHYTHYLAHGKEFTFDLDIPAGNMFTGQHRHSSTDLAFVVNSEGYTQSRGYASGSERYTPNARKTMRLSKAVGYITVWADQGGGERYGQVYFVSNAHCKKCWGGDDILTHVGPYTSAVDDNGKINIFSRENNSITIHNGIKDATIDINYHIIMSSDFRGANQTEGRFRTEID